MIDRLLFKHPRSVGESYGEHLLVAGSFGVSMVGAGLACLVHAVVPCLFERTGSKTIEHLHGRMIRNRRRVGIPAQPGGAPVSSEAA
ncbi:DUF6356 family protein [Sphingomonas sp. Leaf21]|uniref:DUF6356 family protein n=1 Tax=Sphingomonas sp. Leaf21 TaxID=2876550 RepID=UPI001E60B1FC|nr:DUF6356 family protein [Sphingomonas sp. Leaf21]